MSKDELVHEDDQMSQMKRGMLGCCCCFLAMSKDEVVQEDDERPQMKRGVFIFFLIFQPCRKTSWSRKMTG